MNFPTDTFSVSVIKKVILLISGEKDGQREGGRKEIMEREGGRK